VMCDAGDDAIVMYDAGDDAANDGIDIISFFLLFANINIC